MCRVFNFSYQDYILVNYSFFTKNWRRRRNKKVKEKLIESKNAQFLGENLIRVSNATNRNWALQCKLIEATLNSVVNTQLQNKCDFWVRSAKDGLKTIYLIVQEKSSSHFVIHIKN